VRWGLNLRGDLAKLGNNELQVSFDRLMEEREQIYISNREKTGRWLYKKGWLIPFGRGPFHARVFYQIWATYHYGTKKPGSLGQLYMIDCELKDIVDELKRRAS
jgi:hypothetical protein